MNYKLNVESDGDCIAILKSDKKTTKKYQPLICIGEGARSGFEELKLKAGEHFEPTPNINKERDILFVVGASGSGKSYFVSQYARNYKKMHSKSSIYVFSTLDDDKDGIDKIGKIHRIKLDDEFVNGEMIDTKEFENSLVIFDDFDNISNKKTKAVVSAYLNNMLQTGRHYKITLCITFHVSCAGNATKHILNEASSIKFFPQVIGSRNLKYLCESYLGLSKAQIEMVKKLDSRAVTIFRSYPKCYMTDKEIGILRFD